MTRIVVDSREPRAILGLLEGFGLDVIRKPLWAGDYEVGDRAIVERKTARGLHFAIANGTFWPQLGGVRHVGRFAYLLIEGEHLDGGPLKPAAIRGACVAAMDLGVQLIRSEDLADSAGWLLRLVERRTAVTCRSRPAYAQRPRRSAGFPAAQAALAAVPGISEVTAGALLRHFGSLAGVVAASPTGWREVRGVGPNRARAMAQTFHSAPAASRSRRSRERQDLST